MLSSSASCADMPQASFHCAVLTCAQSYPDKDVPPSAVDADAVIEDSIPARTVMAGGSIGLMGRRPPIVMATSEPEGR
jgi:hypothetical protein